MDPLVVGMTTFLSVLGGAVVGTSGRSLLPDDHLSAETETAVKLTMGLLATMAALVIGLLVASAQGSFTTRNNELKQFSVDLILLDRQLAQYGLETAKTHAALRSYARFVIDTTWPDETREPVHDPNGWALLEQVQDDVRHLGPDDDAHRWLQARALAASDDVARMRWLLDVELDHAISVPFLVMLIFWLTAIFASFGLFAPRNAIAAAALLLCAFSVAGALFLIVEMDGPFAGWVRISSAPLREALAQLDR
jgi:hypothetical protein